MLGLWSPGEEGAPVDGGWGRDGESELETLENLELSCLFVNMEDVLRLGDFL